MRGTGDCGRRRQRVGGRFERWQAPTADRRTVRLLATRRRVRLPTWPAPVGVVFRKSSNLCTGCQQAKPAFSGLPSPYASEAHEGGEPVDKPGSVASNHSSRAIVANCLQRPTRDRRGPRHRPPIWPCSGRECLAGPVARARGALLPHPFTLAKPQRKLDGWRSALCCTCRRLAPPRDYLAPCPVEPGLSSGRPLKREDDTRLLDRLSCAKPTPCGAAPTAPARRARCVAGW